MRLDKILAGFQRGADIFYFIFVTLVTAPEALPHDKLSIIDTCLFLIQVGF
jgi:hypothetical protein